MLTAVYYWLLASKALPFEPQRHRMLFGLFARPSFVSPFQLHKRLWWGVQLLGANLFPSIWTWSPDVGIQVCLQRNGYLIYKKPWICAEILCLSLPSNLGRYGRSTPRLHQSRAILPRPLVPGHRLCTVSNLLVLQYQKTPGLQRHSCALSYIHFPCFLNGNVCLWNRWATTEIATHLASLSSQHICHVLLHDRPRILA